MNPTFAMLGPFAKTVPEKIGCRLKPSFVTDTSRLKPAKIWPGGGRVVVVVVLVVVGGGIVVVVVVLVVVVVI